MTKTPKIQEAIISRNTAARDDDARKLELDARTQVSSTVCRLRKSMELSLAVSVARRLAFASALLVSAQLVRLNISKSLTPSPGVTESRKGKEASSLRDPSSIQQSYQDVRAQQRTSHSAGVEDSAVWNESNAAWVPSSNSPGRNETLSSTPSNPPRTLAFFDTRFYAGFRNEGIAFTWFIMYAVQHNFSHILLDSLNWKDLWLFDEEGEGKRRSVHAPHSFLFDVDHWNSYYPRLPRLVEYDARQHYKFDHKRRRFLNPKTAEANATHPYAYGRQLVCFAKYKAYTRQVVSNASLERDPSEVLMLQGTFRPSPDLMRLMDRLHDGEPYLTLHARVEPDMQDHDVPRYSRFKVVRLTEIVEQLERAFPDPPIKKVHVSTFRALLEHEATTNPNNAIALENWNELNRIARDGLWNGTVKVFEAGTDYILKTNSSFGKYASIAGSVVNYFLSLQSEIFVGTEVSSFSLDVMQSRFFCGNRQNHFYRPEGLQLATPLDALQPPRFRC